MAVKVKITSFANHVKILVDERLSPKARSERVAQFARIRIEQADEINRRALGVVPPKTITVDGRQGAPLESVNPNHGFIIAEWRLVGEVIEWIGNTLKQRSPVQSGLYRKSHKLYADNIEANWTKPPIAQEYIFLNPLVYSRKIEIGTVKGPPPRQSFTIHVPNRIYDRTAKDAQAKFGNIARIRFIYSSAVGGSIAKRHAKNDRVPAIVVSLK